MPYVKRELRPPINTLVRKLAIQIAEFSAWNEDGSPKSEPERLAEAAGLLNYAITKLLLGVTGEPRYWKFAIVAGTLQKVAAEYDRRVVAPYEDAKAKANGDVYPDPES